MLTSVIGWGIAWAIGLSAVFYLHPLLGWPLVGLIGGFTVVRMLRKIGAVQRSVDRTIVVMIWLTGAIISAETVDYSIIRGWLIIATFGGLATGLVVFGKSGLMRTIVLTLGWAAGGALGAAFVAKAGSTLAPVFASAIGGIFGWMLCWGIGGIITGAAAGGLISFRDGLSRR